MSLQFTGTTNDIGNTAPFAQKKVSGMLNDIRLYDNLSTYVGKDAGFYNSVGFCNTVYGYEAQFQGVKGGGNVMAGYRAGAFAEGNENIYVGSKSGYAGVDAHANVAVGSVTLALDQGATCNVAIGYAAAYSLRTDASVLIGMCNSVGAATAAVASSNPLDPSLLPACLRSVSVGALAYVTGTDNAGLGYANQLGGRANVSIGPRSTVTGACNVVAGPGVVCTSRGNLVCGGPGLVNEGSNCLILRSATLPPLHNTIDGYINIQDTIIGSGGELRFNTPQLTLTGDVIELKTTRGVTLRLDDQDVTMTPRSQVSVNGPMRVEGAATIAGPLSTLSPVTLNAPVHLDRGATRFWTVSLDLRPEYQGNAADIVFRSRNNAHFAIVDDFVPDVLNFTGKHRCRLVPGCPPLAVGMLVVATGRYCNLDDEDVVEIDEAIPVVNVSTNAYDRRVFGVVSAMEEPDMDERSYRLGNLAFTIPSKSQRVVINSVGEGAILVCDANGPICNGDLLVASPVAGHAMRQDGDVCTAATCAKATCDAAFDQHGRALIGCTYRF